MDFNKLIPQGVVSLASTAIGALAAYITTVHNQSTPAQATNPQATNLLATDPQATDPQATDPQKR